MAKSRTELAEALRAWRDRVSPATVGMPSGGGRRVPGLRREELAALSGLSVDYLVRLEQGRSSNPSPQVLNALAHALRLSVEERDALYRMAGARPPAAGVVPRHVTPGVQRMLDRLVDTPVAVFTSSWEIIQWNPLWAALIGDPSQRSGWDRNLVWRSFTHGRGLVSHEDGQLDAFERELAADLRSALQRYPDDRDLAELAAALRKNSPRFAELWDRFEVVQRVSSRKTIAHPVVGPITLDCDVLTVPGSDLRLVIYTAEPGSPDAASLELLRVTGLQELVDSEN